MSNLNPLFRLRNYIFDAWRDDKRYFLGRALTIIDASISDKEQRKGVKDLIQGAFYEPNHREDEIRKILLAFADKYSPECNLSGEERLGFLGEIPISQKGATSVDYFV